jgi:hypothetical protein
MSPQSTETESGFCDACGWPVQKCVCLDVEEMDDDDADFEDEMCPHGCLPDEECEDCDDE